MMLFGTPDARLQAIVMWRYELLLLLLLLLPLIFTSRGPCLTLFRVDSSSLNLTPTSNGVR